MPRGLRGWIAVGLLGVVWACAGTPGPGETGYPFNISGAYEGEVAVEGQAFSFELEVQTQPGGAFEGTYAVSSPIGMSGPVTGMVVADTATFSLEYMNPMDGCGGTLEATGRVETGGDAFAGRVRVNDSCGGLLSGSFSMRR